MSYANRSHNRIEDSEVLFVSLILLFGEPPTPPLHHGPLEPKVKYILDNKHYALNVKDMMAELGHNPHQGLYTEFMHWVRNQWEDKYGTSARWRRMEKDNAQQYK